MSEHAVVDEEFSVLLTVKHLNNWLNISKLILLLLQT